MLLIRCVVAKMNSFAVRYNLHGNAFCQQHQPSRPCARGCLVNEDTLMGDRVDLHQWGVFWWCVTRTPRPHLGLVSCGDNPRKISPSRKWISVTVALLKSGNKIFSASARKCKTNGFMPSAGNWKIVFAASGGSHMCHHNASQAKFGDPSQESILSEVRILWWSWATAEGNFVATEKGAQSTLPHKADPGAGPRLFTLYRTKIMKRIAFLGAQNCSTLEYLFVHLLWNSKWQRWGKISQTPTFRGLFQDVIHFHSSHDRQKRHVTVHRADALLSSWLRPCSSSRKTFPTESRITNETNIFNYQCISVVSTSIFYIVSIYWLQKSVKVQRSTPCTVKMLPSGGLRAPEVKPRSRWFDLDWAFCFIN